MDTIAYILVPVIFAFMSAVAYAAKPEDRPEEGHKFGHLPKEQRQEAIIAMQEAYRVEVAGTPKDVFHVYFYAEGTSAFAKEYDYVNSPWGRMVGNTKRETVNFVGHGFEPGAKYWLFANDLLIGSAEADEFGMVHIKGVSHDINVSLWILSKDSDGETALMRGHVARISPVKHDH